MRSVPVAIASAAIRATTPGITLSARKEYANTTIDPATRSTDPTRTFLRSSMMADGCGRYKQLRKPVIG